MREMKDSGVKWIGEMPTDWKMTPNYVALRLIKTTVGDKADDYPLLSLTKQGVIKRNIEDGGKFPASFDSYQIIQPGQMVFCLFDIDETPRTVGLSDIEGMITGAYDVFEINNHVCDPRFVLYYYTAVDDGKHLRLYYKSMRKTITPPAFAHVKMPVPPLSEQHQIVSYLDERCVDVDANIAKRREVIEKLGEYKKCLIARVVTKGLDSNVELKDCGVKWIGEMPTDWDIVKGKYCYTLLSRPTTDSDKVITCFRDGEVTLRSNRREEGFTFADKEAGYQGIEPGDLVVHGMDGFAGAIGISDSRGKGTPVLRVLDSRQHKRFLMYLLRAYANSGVFSSIADGIRVRSCNLNWSKLVELPIAIPSIKEQRQIADYLDERCVDVDEAILRQEQLIAKLEEYRKSLIYHAVTGKIDCREEANAR